MSDGGTWKDFFLDRAVETLVQNKALLDYAAENGITLTGGCSQIWGMDLLIAERTGIGCVLADDPDACTAYGAGRMLSRLDSMTDGMQNFARQRQLDKTGN